MIERSLPTTPTKDPSAKKPNYLLRRSLAVAAAGVLTVGAVKATLGFEGGGDSKSSGSGNVPAATMDYLRSLPTQTAEIPAGGGVDDAAYAVDPETFTETPDIHAGVRDIINAQVPKTADGTPSPQANEKVNVPVLPDVNSIPPDAR